MAEVLTLSEFADRLRRVPDRMTQQSRDALDDVGDHFRAAAGRNARQRFRTGTRTANSPRAHNAVGRLRLLLGIDSTQSPGGIMQDTGGTIHAKAGGWLYIPQPDGSFRRVKKVTLRGTRWLTDAGTETKRYASKRLRDVLPAALEG